MNPYEQDSYDPEEVSDNLPDNRLSRSKSGDYYFEGTENDYKK